MDGTNDVWQAFDQGFALLGLGTGNMFPKRHLGRPQDEASSEFRGSSLTFAVFATSHVGSKGGKKVPGILANPITRLAV